MNFIFRIPFAGIESFQLWQPGELDRPHVRVVGLMELLIGKMLAMLERGIVQDVWDMANLANQALDVLKEQSFRARFIALSAILEHPLSTYHRERLESHIDDYVIDEKLRPLIAGSPPLKAKELVHRAWAVVEPFLELAAHENEYLQKIQEGVLQPEILFPDALEESAKFAVHPAIQWKVTNVRSYLKARKSREDKKKA